MTDSYAPLAFPVFETGLTQDGAVNAGTRTSGRLRRKRFTRLPKVCLPVALNKARDDPDLQTHREIAKSRYRCLNLSITSYLFLIHPKNIVYYHPKVPFRPSLIYNWHSGYQREREKQTDGETESDKGKHRFTKLHRLMKGPYPLS